MQIPVQQYPILTPGQMNPWHQALASGLDTYMNMVNAAYQPLKLRSEAASKLAYSQLMGPQFMAKLLGNENILANTDNPQEKVNSLYGAVQNANNLAGAGQSGGLLDSLSDWYHNLFKKTTPVVASGEPRPPETSDVVPGQQGVQYPGTGHDSGYMYDKNGNNVLATPQEVNDILDKRTRPANESLSANQPAPDNSEIYKATDAWIKSPEGKTLAQRQGYYTLPEDAALLDWYRNKQKPDTAATFSENVGKFKGNVKEGEQLGDIRAKDIQKLNDAVYSAKANETTFNELADIVSSPEFEQIRQIPLAQQHELAYYSKFGTPEQQRLIGRYYTLTGNIIKDSARDFPGVFRVGEQTLLQGMKPNPSDTVEVARGKLQSLMYLNKMIMDRSALTSKIIEKYHVNKLEAEERADLQVNGNYVRRQINDRINPKANDADISFMAKKYNISEAEVKRRLKARGAY